MEHDESLKLPTVGDLLSRMFNEQKISFTKVCIRVCVCVCKHIEFVLLQISERSMALLRN